MATFYASHFATPSPRSLLLLNSFSYVDAYLAGVLHDCMNVFNCAPESRPDLPVYFHARFLFSPAYLGQVKTCITLQYLKYRFNDCWGVNTRARWRIFWFYASAIDSGFSVRDGEGDIGGRFSYEI